MMAKQARWRCETCKGELTMPARFGVLNYACCNARMTFVGFERAQAIEATPTEPK